MPRVAQLFSRRLSLSDRLWWSVGSPVRLTSLIAFTGVTAWLGLISIGWSAVAFLVGLVAFVHILPFMWARRLRLVIDHVGVHDQRRFRSRSYRWDQGCAIWENQAQHQHFRGLIVTDKAGLSQPAVMLSSWCRGRAELTELCDQIRAAGYNVQPADD